MNFEYKNTWLYLKSILIVQILFFSVAGNAFCSGGDTSRTLFDIIWNDIKDAGYDAQHVGNEIVGSGWNDLLVSSSVTAGTLSFMTLDDEMRSLARRNQSDGAANFFNVTNEFGDKYAIVAASAGIYLTGLISGDEYIRTTGRLIAESLLLSGIYTTGFKVILGRARPFANEGNFSFHWFEFQDKYNSLPSGHSSASFAIFTVLVGRINTWWAYSLYVFPVTTMMARMYLDKHWLSDTFAGAAIGFLSGLAVLNAEKSRKGGKDGGWMIYPSGNGVGIVYRF